MLSLSPPARCAVDYYAYMPATLPCLIFSPFTFASFFTFDCLSRRYAIRRALFSQFCHAITIPFQRAAPLITRRHIRCRRYYDDMAAIWRGDTQQGGSVMMMQARCRESRELHYGCACAACCHYDAYADYAAAMRHFSPPCLAYAADV